MTACIHGLTPTDLHIDPMFFLHHAVCTIFSFIKNRTHTFLQMIDKVWYDWQNQDPSNKNIFAGGSISWAADSNISYSQYPTGAPPLLNVRRNSSMDGRLWRKY